MIIRLYCLDEVSFKEVTLSSTTKEMRHSASIDLTNTLTSGHLMRLEINGTSNKNEAFQSCGVVKYFVQLNSIYLSSLVSD